jgi:hypothetical protein
VTDGLSLRALARLMGVSEKAVRKALAVGVFSAEAVRRDEGGLPVVMNATLAVQEWERSGRQLRGTERRQAPAAAAAPAIARPVDTGDAVQPALEDAGDEQLDEEDADLDEPGGPTSAPLPPSLVAAQTQAMLERVRKLRMENNLREGTLVEVEQARREAFDFARSLRENVLNIPARLAAELAAETDTARVFARLEGALREALEATAAALEGRAGE